jgi:hypothetical protein
VVHDKQRQSELEPEYPGDCRQPEAGCWHVTNSQVNSTTADPDHCRRPCVSGTRYCEQHQLAGKAAVPVVTKVPIVPYWWCHCEARRNKGEHCQLCMGRVCRNRTYEHKGTVYNLLEATLLWSTDYYDGPLAGIAAYKGLICFAKTYTWYRDRSFWLFPLRASEWAVEMQLRASWLLRKPSNVPDPDRSVYLSRKPIGFFRLDYRGGPLVSNVIHDEYRQRQYEHLFAEHKADE